MIFYFVFEVIVGIVLKTSLRVAWLSVNRAP